MVDAGPGDNTLLDPFRERRPKKRPARETFFLFLVYFTFSLAFLFLIISIILVISPTWGTALSQPVNPYFFVFLEVFFFAPVPIISIFVVMFALYIVIFITLVVQSGKDRKKNVLDTPIGYLVAVASAVELVAVIISKIENMLGTSIGGTSIDSQLQNNPLLGYMSLIYAPFVEELGFRIIPLGVYSFILTVYVSLKKNGLVNLKDSLLSIIIPGHVRRKYNIHLGGVDWILIIATSAIFGYAHIYFGAWDWGKFIPVFVTGIALAVGYLKFGVYVDIPGHWFFNGFMTLFYLDPALVVPSGLLVLWFLFVGVVSLIAIAAYVRGWRGGLGPA